MSDKRVQLADKKYSLLLTRIAYGSAAVNIASTLSQMIEINEKISMNIRTIDIISLVLSGIVVIGGIGHTNDIKFDIDELKDEIGAKER